MHRLSIEDITASNSGGPKVELKLDGVPVKGIRSYTLHREVGDVPRLTLELYVEMAVGERCIGQDA